MKSLEERLKQRAASKKKEENLGEAPKNQKSDDNFDSNAFSAKDYLSDSIENIKKRLSTATDEELDSMIEFESSDEGQKRAGAKDALSTEKTKRNSNSNGWSGQ